MKNRSNDWIVGAAIIVSMLGIVASTLYLQQADIGQKRSDVSARFRDVGTLQVGNSVVIRGVRAGRVEQIALAPADWVASRRLCGLSTSGACRSASSSGAGWLSAGSWRRRWSRDLERAITSNQAIGWPRSAL